MESRAEHVVGSRMTEAGGFEYYCHGCEYLARYENGSFQVIAQGHRRHLRSRFKSRDQVQVSQKDEANSKGREG